MMLSRRVLAVGAALLTLSGCGLFMGSPKRASEAERAGRVPLSVLEQKLKADPEMATANVELPAPAAMTEWTQAGGQPSKVPGNIDAAPEFKIDWSIGAGAGSADQRRIVAPPVVKDGRIYIIDAEQKVTAYSVDRGQRIWQVTLKSSNKKDGQAIGGGLAISGDTLVVSSGYAFIVGLKLEDGQEVWRHRTESPMSGSAAVAGDRAYVTSVNNDIYAINVASGQVDWSDSAISESARISSSPSPALSNELLVAPFSSGELVAYLPANGRRLWVDTLTSAGRFTPLSAINDIAGRPAVEEGVVYAGSFSGVLAAIDARSGQRIWDVPFGTRLGPVPSGSYLFVMGTNGQVVALSKFDGKVVWVRDLPEYKKGSTADRLVWTGPLIASGRIIVGNSEGDLLALDAQTGQTKSELKVGGPVLIEPIAAAGKIFVLTDNGQLIAIK